MTLESGTEVTQVVTGTHDNAGITEHGVHATATLPNTYAAQPNAGVHVVWGVIAKNMFSDNVFCDTTLSNYLTDIPSACNSVYALWQSWHNAPTATPAGLGADVEIHWSIKLDNPTAPPPQMGAWVQAKAHYDGHLSDANISSVADIQNPILNTIPYIQEIAKY